MPRLVTEHHTGTVLRAFDLVHRTQIVSFKTGQVIEVDGQVRDQIEASEQAFVAWDGEIPPHSKSLPSSPTGLPWGA